MSVRLGENGAFDGAAGARKFAERGITVCEVGGVNREASGGLERRVEVSGVISRILSSSALVVACLSTLGTGKAQWLADTLRTLDAFTRLSIRYKPFRAGSRQQAR